MKTSTGPVACQKTAIPPFEGSPSPGPRTIAQLLRQQVANRADDIALVGFRRPTLTYGRLAEEVEALRRGLLDLGLSRGHRVALVTDGNEPGAIAFLAIASITACAPLRPLSSPQEMEFFLGDLRADALVIEKGMPTAARGVAENRDLPIFELSSSESAGAADAASSCLEGAPIGPKRPVEDPEPDDVVLLLHTTGSTSRPKLVPFTQSSLLHTAWGTSRALELTPRDRCLTFMPLFHVHGLVSGVLVPLVSGGSVACVGAFDRDAFFAWMESLQPTWYSTSPPIHQIILRQAHRRFEEGCRWPSLRFVRSGSAVLAPKVARELEQIFGVPVIEAYGMTEVPNISGNPVDAPRLGSVGRSAGPEIAILGEGDLPLPIGSLGEVAVRGPSVTRGYENDAEATAEAFRGSWFCTGDLGRLDEEGYLFLEGRKKEQINRGGDKIAPMEIDQVLNELDGVEQAVAFAIPHPTLGEDLVAAVVPRRPGTLSEAGLLRGLGRRLAPHKVPTRILVVEELSIGATGKPERAKVAAELRPLLEGATESNKAPGIEALPTSPVERLVAEAWQEVLALSAVGLDDDFFALGATSLDIVALAAHLEKILGEAVHPPLIAAQPTVRSLARRLGELYAPALARVSSLPLAPSPTLPPIVGSTFEGFRESLRRRWGMPLGEDSVRAPRPDPRPNPRAVFVLSAPRSGSTLLRSMMAGHPELFAPPELRLLHFRTLEDWWQAHAEPFAFFREGLLQAWATAFELDPTEAEVQLEDRRRAGVETAALVGEMQQRLGGRILVDKTPLYAVDPLALERMESDFREPLYVHLIRHPLGMVNSYLRTHMDQLWIGEQPFPPQHLAEMLWAESQEQVLRHLRSVPAERCHRIEFETLVADSEGTLRGLCDFLGLDFERAMLRPYDNPEGRMTEGFRRGSTAIGDPKFRRHRKIDPAVATAWVEQLDSSTLSEPTLGLAAHLGYGSGPEIRPLEGLRRLRGMVRAWKGVRAHPDSWIVGRNREGTRRPLYWCLQSEQELIQLAAGLGPDQPVRGMRSAHYALVKTPQSLHALAELYADEINSLEPDGPIRLGGNCQGARIAFDIACLLQEKGRQVDILFLMEAFIERTYAGKVALIYGAESRRQNPYYFHPDPEAAWGEGYAEHTLDLIPGAHGEFFEPGRIEILAEILQRRLQEVAPGEDPESV